MALDDSGRPEDSRTENDEDMVDDDSNSLDCLDDDSDCEEDYDSDCEEDSSDNEEGDDSEWKEMPRLINQQADEIIKKNENILRLEEENTAKARLIEELKEKVERLTEGGLDMERDITDLERLIQEKDRQICSLPAEMEKLRKEIALKAKDTERLIKENEEKDSKIIILESTAVVLEMEKETLYRNLNEMEINRNRTHIQLNNLNENFERLRQENKIKQNQLENLQKENEDKELRINGLVEKLEILNTEKQRADENLKQLEQYKKEMAEAKKEVEKLAEQTFQKDREILRLENECSQKQNLVIGLLNEKKNAVSENVNRNLNEMTRRTIQLEFELAETKEELDTMEFEKLEATVEIERLQEDNFAKDQKIRSLESQVEMLKEEKTNGTVKEKEVFLRKKNVVKMAPKEQSASENGDEKKKALGKTRCLRKPQINCKAFYEQIDSIEEELRQIRAQKQPSADTKRHAKALAKTPAIKKPLSTEEVHKKMRVESAARLRRLEEDAKMVKNLYKINSVT
ncbi:ELKS/Rab6-interacting/CAST family member 1-like [Macrobrachium rosenbergii]|uniref:ELKS/Rab6-interacting/CAST family member 1-like n=1 Tax=Macrobrachium rosenbergii TaxID=79674 RepID=UPI0034D494F9